MINFALCSLSLQVNMQHDSYRTAHEYRTAYFQANVLYLAGTPTLNPHRNKHIILPLTSTQDSDGFHSTERQHD